MDSVAKIENRIHQALHPEKLEIIDDSLSHAGHAGARDHGGGHYYATIVAQAFDGKSLIERHKMVYQALGDLMQSEIHAFSIKAYTPHEMDKGNQSNA